MKKYFFVVVFIITTCLQTTYAQVASDSLKLSQFAGKYQFSDDKMTFLQISEKNSHLVLKQLWDNQEIVFERTGKLTFYNKESSFPLAFTENQNGGVKQVLAFDRDTWNKVPDNYIPELQKIIKLSSEDLKTFEGKYQLKGGDGDADDFIQIKAADDHLILKQQWDQQEENIWPVSSVEFFNDKQNFPIKFTKEKDGTVSQLLAKNKDVWTKVKKQQIN
jgi:hypothetical protein